MKKTLTYVATAALLGIAIMMLPRGLESYMWQSEPIQPLSPSSTETNVPRGDNYLLPPYGLGGVSISLLPPAFILLSGLAVALCIYTVFRRRTT